MSRIGNLPVNLPPEVKVEIEPNQVVITGPLGSLTTQYDPQLVKVDLADNHLLVSRTNDLPATRARHGLIRALLHNCVVGVTKGWTKRLLIEGTGYRANLMGQNIELNVGFSHPVKIKAVEGVKLAVEDQKKITVSGIDKVLVGQTAAIIRQVKPPEPYKGKGIRYADEVIRRKAGKSAKATA